MAELTVSHWTDVWTMPWARAVIGLVVLCVVIAIGFYVVSRFRDYADNNRPAPFFADSKLQEMLRRGEISEAEYRTIQSKSHGVSIVLDESQSTDQYSNLASPASNGPVGASHADETEQGIRFLPPSTS